MNLRDEYPIDLLPKAVREPIQAVEFIIQAPLAMAGQSILAAVNFAVQEHVNVRTPYGERPVSEYYVTLGQSGERKSAVDRLALAGLDAWERRNFAGYEQRRKQAEQEVAEYDAERKSIAKMEGTKEYKAQMIADLGSRPALPLYPKRTVKEPTVQGLMKLFKDGHPSLGMFSDEAGSFLGGFAMGKDNALHTAAILSDLWDGKPVERIRGGDDLGLMYGRRLSSHLMLQPGIAAKLLESPMFQNQGLTARFLLAYPHSTVGKRLHRRAADDQRRERDARIVMADFAAKTQQILDTEAPRDEHDCQVLAPRPLGFSPQAQQIWLDWTDEVEKACGPSGLLNAIVGLGNKAGEHAARLAATLTAFEDLAAGEIPEDHMQAGIALVEYHLRQHLGILGELPDPTEESRDLGLLESWIEKWPEPYLCISNISAEGPKRLRGRKDQIVKFVKLLVNVGTLQAVNEPKQIKGKLRHQAFQIMRE